MPRKQHVFTVADWLLKAASVFFIFVTVVLTVTLIACVVAAVSPNHFGIPDNLEGVARADAFLIGGLATGFGMICLMLVFFATRAMAGIVQTARSGDPFVNANADRLTRIGWLLLTVNLVSIIAGATLGSIISQVVPKEAQDHVHFGFDVSPVGLFGVLLIFVLAQIFRHGSEMRAELEGTV